MLVHTLIPQSHSFIHAFILHTVSSIYTQADSVTFCTPNTINRDTDDTANHRIPPIRADDQIHIVRQNISHIQRVITLKCHSTADSLGADPRRLPLYIGDWDRRHSFMSH